MFNVCEMVECSPSHYSSKKGKTMIYIVEVANAIIEEREASVPCPPQGARKSIVMAAMSIAQLMRDAETLEQELQRQNTAAAEIAARDLAEALQQLNYNDLSVEAMIESLTERLEAHKHEAFLKENGEKPLQEGYAKRLANVLTGLIQLLKDHGEECGDDDGGFIQMWPVDGGGSPRCEPPPPPPAFLGLAPR